MTDHLWDSTYDGPRWTYGLVYRPAGYAQVPDGYILMSARPHPNFKFGTIDYPFQLEYSKAESFEMVLVESWDDEPDDFRPCDICGGEIGHKINCPKGIAFSNSV